MPPDRQPMNATAMHPRKPQPARFRILQFGIGGLLCNDYWWSEHNGVEYYVLRDKSVPQFPLNEALYLDQPIVEIDLNGKRTVE